MSMCSLCCWGEEQLKPQGAEFLDILPGEHLVIAGDDAASDGAVLNLD